MWLLFGYFPLSVRVSLGFRQAHNLKVAGSNPAPATTKTLPSPLSDWMAVFLCLEQLVDLLPVITRRVQPVGKRPVRFDDEFHVRPVADIPNARRVLKRAKTATFY